LYELRLRRLYGKVVAIVTGLGMAWAALYALLMIGWQTLEWLKSGRWPSRTNREWLWESFERQLGHTEWVGFNKILDAFGDAHIAVLMVVIMVVIGFVAGHGCWVYEKADNETGA